MMPSLVMFQRRASSFIIMLNYLLCPITQNEIKKRVKAQITVWTFINCVDLYFCLKANSEGILKKLLILTVSLEADACWRLLMGTSGVWLHSKTADVWSWHRWEPTSVSMATSPLGWLMWQSPTNQHNLHTKKNKNKQVNVPLLFSGLW